MLNRRPDKSSVIARILVNPSDSSAGPLKSGALGSRRVRCLMPRPTSPEGVFFLDLAAGALELCAGVFMFQTTFAYYCICRYSSPRTTFFQREKDMGMNGWLAGGYIADGLNQAAAGQQALADAKSYVGVVNQLVEARQKLAEVEDSNAGNLAEKHALRAALRNIDPKHPLIVNTSLQERIKEAGKKALAITNDWNASREAGESFKY